MADLTATIGFLLGWIAANTAYTNADRLPPPVVVIMPQRDIDRGCATCFGGGAAATYHCDTKTIAISREAIASLGTRLDPILAHELTHHAQCLAWGAIPRARECAAEREAYDVSARYLVYQLGDLPETRVLAQRHRDAAEKACAASRR